MAWFQRDSVFWHSLPLNLGKHGLTLHRSALPANPTSSRPRSWSLGNAALVVAGRNGWRPVLGASKPRQSVKAAHPYRKRACLEALRLATTKLTQRGTEDTWGHPTQLRIPEEAQGWSILRIILIIISISNYYNVILMNYVIFQNIKTSMSILPLLLCQW